MFNQVDNSGRVTVFVVVPGDQLDESWGQLDTSVSIDDRRVGVTQEVRGDNIVFGVSQDTLHGALRSLLQGSLDLVVGGFLGQVNGQVNNRNIDGWNSEGHTSQLTLQGWQNLTDSLGSTSGRWDDVTRGGSTTSPVLVGWTVNSLLGGGQRVDSGHQTFLDTEFVVDDLSQWGQTVGGTRSVGDDLLVWSVSLIVDTHDVHWGGTRWSSDNNLLGTSFNVLVSGVNLLEDTGGVDSDINTQFTPWQSRWVLLVEDSDLLTVQDNVVFVVRDLTVETTVSRVVLEHVSSVVSSDEWVVDSDQADIASGDSDSGD